MGCEEKWSMTQQLPPETSALIATIGSVAAAIAAVYRFYGDKRRKRKTEELPKVITGDEPQQEWRDWVQAQFTELHLTVTTNNDALQGQIDFLRTLVETNVESIASLQPKPNGDEAMSNPAPKEKPAADHAAS
jgi:hypothetical protein